MTLQVTNCLYCGDKINKKAGWITFIGDDILSKFCLQCTSLMYRLKGKRCSYCSREMNSTIKLNIPQEFCSDCLYWKNNNNCFFQENSSIFSYTDFMQEIIMMIKYRGDSVLMSGFASIFRKELLKYVRGISWKNNFGKGDLCFIPVPLSTKRLEERGFNQVEVLGRYSKIPLTLALKRDHGEKQAKKTRRQRLLQEAIFQINYQIKLKKVVILLDDLYTTGSTLQNCASTLRKSKNVKQIYTFTLIRS